MRKPPEISRKVREVRKVMKGGNEASETSVVTLYLNRAYQNDAAENLPRMDSALGVQLDGAAPDQRCRASANNRSR